MIDYSPLADSARVSADDDDPIAVTEQSVTRKLREVSTSRMSGPDDIPIWVLKEYSDSLVVPIPDIIQSLYLAYGNWPMFHHHPRRQLSLTLTKLCGQSHLLQPCRRSLRALLSRRLWSPWCYPILIQVNLVSSRVLPFALISMFHHWLRATDGTGASVRTALLDFRKAFDLMDHNILVGKLHILGVKPTAIKWIIDLLKDRRQRVKLNGVYSDWINVPACVPQGTPLGS